MEEKKLGWVQFCLVNAKVILHARDLRRKLATRILCVLIGMFGLGVFLIQDWLDKHVILFTVFWGAVFILTILVAMLAIYDGLRVASEVRLEHNKEMAQQIRDLAETIREEQERAKKEKEN